MHALGRHLARVFIAGIVALLPIGGTVLTVVYLETTIANDWVRRQWWYFPGLGLVAAAIIIYLIGLTVTTFLGRWIWNRLDRLFDSLPALGALYKTLKQVLGYGEGREGLFQQVVLVPGRDSKGVEIGLVTNDLVDDAGRRMFTVFIPGSPTPTAGRLVVIEASKVHAVSMPVSEALKALVSVGKTEGVVDVVRRAGDVGNPTAPTRP
ncbi:MAG: DUF502 domain-containing protein [Phycisphaeraceae bacterium]|nr:DUF502 domain-containing protein [Phycisphaerales bacterium]QOJ17336.1 MAG: DUF502 domain-containing protein [Phycisphaeraceae bacterium]